MPNPTAGDVHVNTPLTNISIAYIQRQENFIADRVFPMVPVLKQSDRYFVYNRADFYRTEARERVPGTESAGGGWRLDNTPTYFATPYAVHKDIDDITRANADAAISMDRDATLYVTQQLLIKRDLVWASKYFTTGLWTGASGGTDLTGVASGPGSNQFLQWSQAGSTPLNDIRAQIYAIMQNTGYKPNKLVLGAQVWQILADHPQLLDRIKYTQTGIVAPSLLASALELDEVIVAGATNVTTVEGAASDTYSFILGKQALLCYANPTPSLMMPSAGYTFSWTGYLGAGAAGNRIKTFRIEPIASDRVEGEMAFDTKLIAAPLGAFFTSAVA